MVYLVWKKERRMEELKKGRIGESENGRKEGFYGADFKLCEVTDTPFVYFRFKLSCDRRG